MLRHPLRGWGLPVVVASLLPIFLTFHTLRAQGLGTIVGTLTDPSGAVVPNAKIRLVEEGTSASREATSDAQGYYVFPSLRPSSYSLTVEAPGFATLTRKGITLQADENVTVNLGMSLAQAGQQVTVEAVAALVNTTTSTLSEVVDTRRIVDLPLDGRNAASLALITAGTLLAPNADGADQGNTKTFPAAVLVNSNGARQNQTSYRLDGASNTDLYTNVNQPFPNPDALQEFSVQTSNYSAKYGGNAGGVVNIVTKSGANDVHGSAYEFVRNADLNARNFFAAQRDPLKRNQFGGAFGGPVDIPKVYNGKNKTFFFMSYQGTRIHTIGSTTSEYVPTAANKSGDFSAYLTANPSNPLNKATVINDPLTGMPFPGNIIPTSRFDPAAVAFTKYLPTGIGSGLIYYTLPTIQDFDEATVRVDHSISTKDHLTGRYFFDRFYNVGFLNLTKLGTFRVTALFVRVMTAIIALHTLEILLWASCYRWLCFPSWEPASYFSASSYATVGYGDVVLPRTWRMLGPLESVVGVLMCGLSVSVLFAIATRLAATKGEHRSGEV